MQKKQRLTPNINDFRAFRNDAPMNKNVIFCDFQVILVGSSFAFFGGPWPRLGDPWLPLEAFWKLVDAFCVLLGGSSEHH